MTPLAGRTLEQELMLRLAGTAAVRNAQASRIEELARACDYDRLRTGLEEHRLLSVLGRRLADAAPGPVPRWFTEKVEASTAHACKQNMVLEILARKLIDDLERAGIPTMPLKGPALAQSIYGDLGLRPSSDIDLLVGPENLHRAVAVMRHAGYEAPRDPIRRDGLPQLHFNLEHRDGLPNVEVHWRVHWYERRFSSEMLANAPLTGDGRRASLPDELATLLLMYARDGFLGLRLCADIAAWWDAHCQQVGRGCLDSIVDRHPALVPALVTAAQVAAMLVGFPASDAITREVPAGRRARVAARLANWSGDGDFDQRAATVVLVDGLLTPRRALWSFVRRGLLLAPDAIAHRLGRRASNALVGHLMAIEYAAKVVVRWGIALWRSAGRHRSLDSA